jgi:hypothetical protein
MAGTQVDRLLAHLTDGDPGDVLNADLRRWIEGSRAFRAFAETHRDKIRKKVRTAGQGDARRDLRSELAVAGAVLADRRIELAYERAGATQGGPDFTVTYRSHLAFNLEVTRWRGDLAALERQLVAKLRQLPPSVANALLLAVDGERGGMPDIEALVAGIRSGGAATRELRQRLTRLGGVYSWSERAKGAERATLWTNGAAKIALPTPAARAVLMALQASP